MTPMGFASYDDRPRVSAGRVPAAVDAAEMSEGEGTPMDPIRARIDPQQAEESLSERDRRILEFERQWWKYAGAKEQAIRDLFDMSPTRYYQILNGLIDTPAALSVDPMLVKRLRRMRSARQRARSARRLGIDVDPR